MNAITPIRTPLLEAIDSHLATSKRLNEISASSAGDPAFARAERDWEVSGDTLVKAVEEFAPFEKLRKAMEMVP